MKKIIFATLVAGAFVLASCGGGNKSSLVTSGSLSKFDTLSYAVGVNLAAMTTTQISDLPLDYEVLVESLVASAKGTNKTSHEEATATLQDYFMNERAARAAQVEATRNEADSIALANGADQAVVVEAREDMPAAAEMFESAAERSAISAALGNDLGNSIVSAKIPVQTVWLKEAFLDVVNKESKMAESVANAEIQKYFMVTMPQNNKKNSDEWLASIESKSGVKKTESGILYKIEKSGSDIFATDDRDVVKVKYTGKNRAGKVFDSSRYSDMSNERKEFLRSQSADATLPEDGEIIEFPLNRVIKGWTEGMKLVGVGGRISLWIPSELAYGTRGAGADIAANEALYFDVELIDVIPYEEEQSIKSAE